MTAEVVVRAPDGVRHYFHNLFALLLVGCAGSDSPIVIDLASELDAESTGTVTRPFEVDGRREVIVRAGDVPIVVEGWVDGGTLDVSGEQLAAGASASWLAPHTAIGDETFEVVADGSVTLAVHARGTPAPPAIVERSLAWLDGALLDDASVVSFARVMAAISDDGHGGRLLERWFAAFAAGPGAGRATFAGFIDDVAVGQGADPAKWDLGALPFKVTGIHNRIDLAKDGHCGELRVSVASTDARFSPVHLIFLFREQASDDDATPDGNVHCRGAARRWARLSALDDVKHAARALVASGFTRERFLLAESVELSISPWQWRQWQPTADGGMTNPLLFQTVDVARVNVSGELRDEFLDHVQANAGAIAARTWVVPAGFRSATADVLPNEKAPLVDVGDPELARAIGMIGCPRCHTDNADFVHTGIDRKPSPFYDLELDARAVRLDALAGGEWPQAVPFGPLQPLRAP
jgi:hypothetical protein